MGLGVGRNERNSGGAPFCARSHSSQQNVRASPLASVPLAVSLKGVPMGRVLPSGGRLTLGTLLPVLLTAPHVVVAR